MGLRGGDTAWHLERQELPDLRRTMESQGLPHLTPVAYSMDSLGSDGPGKQFNTLSLEAEAAHTALLA